MAVQATLSGNDYSFNARGKLESTSTSFWMADVTPANLAAQSILLDNLQAAFDGISLIDFTGKELKAVDDPRGSARPASPFAQRETKWLVSYVDDVTGKQHTMEIGGADLALVGDDGKTLNVAAGAGAAFVTAFEAGVKSPVGNDVTFLSAVHVGRNI